MNTQYQCESPVLFLTFNRLDTTKRVFEAIRKVKPQRLFFASDGPRKDCSGEEEKVREVRDFVLRSIDWDCEVKRLLRDSNLGCKHAVAGAIDWFFENEEKGIILEDDCLPNSSFFRFCDELLEKYKLDYRIAKISGFNQFSQQLKSCDYSYFYSHYGYSWGWASWRRFWETFNLEDYPRKNWLIAKKNGYRNFGPVTNRVADLFDRLSADGASELTTWDFQVDLHRCLNSGLAVVPKSSLIQNIGFNGDGTHTNLNAASDSRASVRAEKCQFPLVSPSFVSAYPLHDKIIFRNQARSRRKSILKKLISLGG